MIMESANFEREIRAQIRKKEAMNSALRKILSKLGKNGNETNKTNHTESKEGNDHDFESLNKK